MSTDTQSTDRAAVAGHLSDAQAQTEAGRFQDALATLKKAKSLEPRNVYVLAFEKQVEQLVELSDMKILTDEQKSDILDSIPGIIERALEPTATEGKALTIGGRLAETQATLERERAEKTAALDWLKNQYFQHAHEYVRKGEYQNALTEIRRVYIIDPANRIAKDFEQQIEQLLSLHKVQNVPKSPLRPTRPEGQPVETAAGSSRTPREGTAPPVSAEPSQSPPATPETEQETGRRGMSPALTIGIILALLAVAVILYSFFGGR
jgi:tetratricopeptide (TPR) repeat protein